MPVTPRAIAHVLGDSLLGLRPVATDSFDENRVGLDHVSFAVASRADLDTAATALEARGTPRAGIKDIVAGYILEFRDPDGIALELFSPKT